MLPWKPSEKAVSGGRRDGLLDNGVMPCLDRLNLPPPAPVPLLLFGLLPLLRLRSLVQPKPAFQHNQKVQAVKNIADLA